MMHAWGWSNGNFCISYQFVTSTWYSLINRKCFKYIILIWDSMHLCFQVLTQFLNSRGYYVIFLHIRSIGANDCTQRMFAKRFSDNLQYVNLWRKVELESKNMGWQSRRYLFYSLPILLGEKFSMIVLGSCQIGVRWFIVKNKLESYLKISYSMSDVPTYSTKNSSYTDCQITLA